MQEITHNFKTLNLVQKLLLGGWLTLMLLLPFHAFISTWGGSSIGPYSLWKVWKEVVLVLLCIPTFLLLREDRSIWKKAVSSWLLRIGAFYVLFHVIITLLVGRDADAVLYGLAINLRIILFFFVSFVLFSSLKLSRRSLAVILLAPCTLVVFFGILQLFVLPNNFLSHFGYEKGVTIAPTNNIDDQPDQIRIMSTLRGPNPLGAYLILPGALLVCVVPILYARLRRGKTGDAKNYMLVSSVLFLGLLVSLYGTHGRAAWIGFAVSIAVAVFFMLGKKLRLYAVGAGLIAVCVFGVVLYQLRDTSFVQNVILHDNPETGGEVTSNGAHLTSAKQGIKDIFRAPLTGCGPGCAGPASFYYEKGTKLAENYYLQIGQEVGVFGLALFIAFLALVAKELFLRKNDPLALALFASLLGISVANLLLHVWADDTLAYVWWGVAGVVLANGIPKGSVTATAKHLRTSE